MAYTEMRVGDRVECTGIGQARRFKGWKGSIVEIADNGLMIQFDGLDGKPTLVQNGEVRPRVHWGCPCAICSPRVQPPLVTMPRRHAKLLAAQKYLAENPDDLEAARMVTQLKQRLATRTSCLICGRKLSGKRHMCKTPDRELDLEVHEAFFHKCDKYCRPAAGMFAKYRYPPCPRKGFQIPYYGTNKHEVKRVIDVVRFRLNVDLSGVNRPPREICQTALFLARLMPVKEIF